MLMSAGPSFRYRFWGLFAAEGSNIVVNYVSRKDRADEVAEKCRREFEVKVMVIQADIGVAEDSIRLVKETVQQLGGLDIIINNAGWTRFANFGDINDLSHDEWNKCWSTNVMSQLVLMQEAAPIFNANPDGGVFLISSSIAGPKIRVNAVLPGLLLTEWGLRYSEERIQAAKNAAALKHETYLEDCADAYISTAKNTSMTGQQIVVDAGMVIA
ncbi:hypothetical protein ABEF95_007232 [Exophiala dermatitidis]